ncbi:UNVERIFIED_CONTAM: hypothetical protein RMT77_008957 [Armadillidium vulgare]
MKYLFVLLFILLTSAQQDNIVDIICPLPGNPDPSTVAEEQCYSYPACEYTSGSCHMKSNEESGYVVASEPVTGNTGIQLSLRKANPENTFFGTDIEELSVDVIYHEDYHVQFKIYDSSSSRYEVPIQRNLPDTPGNDPLFEVTTASTIDEPFYLEIKRKSTGTVVFRTRGPLTFEDQFIQITTSLASSYFYGIGEFCHSSLLRSFDQRTTNALFASDRGPSPGSDVNLYGSYPYYLNIEDDDGNTHSVFLENSNALEYSTFMLDGSPAVTVRAIGGILDFHLFFGPTPDDVTVQYTEFVGRPYLPPYWALGFQLSRWGYNSLDEYQVIHDRMIASQIPWDVQHFDIDYMDGRRDFTYDQVNFNNISTVADQLHSENKKLILIKDPGIAIDFDTYPTVQRGKDKDVFIKYSDPSYVPDDQPALTDDYVVGNVWPINNTLFPDFFNPVTAQWWSEELQLFHETVEFDAIWIDMDEPSNFYTNLGQFFEEIGRFSLQCPNNTLDFPPYGTLATFSDNNPNPGLSDKTICMSSIQTDGTNQYLHYDIHNLYGYSEAVATYNALSQDVFPNERPFILTRSSFPGSAPYTSHWLGDNTATFADLRASLIGIVEFNLFGISMIGADVCGFRGESNEELCSRWMQAGAFYSFFRNHNMIGTTDQDPARPDWPTLNQVSKDIVTLRYKYLPFMYSAIHRAHMFGNPAIRSLFVVFPSDLDARGIQDQFMWSDKLLVAPVVYEQATSRDVYFPDSLWYDLQSGTLEAQGPITSSVDAPIEKIPLYVRGGSILPFQFPSVNTVESRQNPFGLTVALDRNSYAQGELYWDDGHSQHTMDESYLGTFSFDGGELSLSIQYNATIASDLVLTTINIYGYPSNPSGITVNGEAANSTSWNYSDTTGVLSFFPSLTLGEEFLITFS